MKKTIATFIVALMLTLSVASAAFAAQPPGQKGYEGVKGHQAGGPPPPGQVGP